MSQWPTNDDPCSSLLSCQEITSKEQDVEMTGIKTQFLRFPRVVPLCFFYYRPALKVDFISCHMETRRVFREEELHAAAQSSHKKKGDEVNMMIKVHLQVFLKKQLLLCRICSGA